MLRFRALVLVAASALIVTRPDIASARGAATGDAQEIGRYQYLQPVPGSRLVSPWNNIVIRLGSIIDRSTLDDRALVVVGSRSGIHTGRLVISDDMKTLVYKPDQPFALGETVVVRLEQGVRALGGAGLPTLSFSFTVSATDPKQQLALTMNELFPDMPAAAAAPRRPPIPLESRKLTSMPCYTLPPSYPVATVLNSNDPAPGDLFMAPFDFNSFGDILGRLLIVDNLGMPVFYRAIIGLGTTFDFKRQPNGFLTYYLNYMSKFFALDSAYAVVDSFETGNGYRTDLHDFQLLPDGHALLMSYDLEPVDMSAVVTGGNPRARVFGLILQELDAAKNVVFQWRSWDHFAITDLASPQIALTDSVIDYVHGNAVELDYDGNLLLSSRHMNEITKINRQTGDIIWRLGLHAVNNQFAFVNDTRGFREQHDIRRLSNGHVTLFDNGNFSTPQYSRAVEYDLDEVNKLATLVWEYRDLPDVFGGFMGNVQRQANGGTTIGWGGTFSDPKMTDLHADGTKALELAFKDSTQLLSYRAFRFPWRTTRFATNADSLAFGTVGMGGRATLPLTVRNTTAGAVTITCAISTDPAFTLETELPRTLDPGGNIPFLVSFAPTDEAQHRATLYLRQVTETDLVAQTVTLRGTGLGVAAVAGELNPQFGLRANRPNPFERGTTIEFAVPRMEKVRLEILDVRGRLIETLVDGVRAAGRYEVTWASKHAASGMYFCRLEAGGRTETRKLALLK